MTTPARPDRDTLLMMLSAHLDGELSPADEAVVLDALGEDDELLEAFELMSAARVGAMSDDALSLEESRGLTAAILAATTPSDLPETAESALALAQLALDDALPPGGAERLDQLVGSSASNWASDVADLAASVEATRAVAAAVAAVPAVAARLQALPAEVGARIASAERLELLASAASDDALLDTEAAELEELLAGPASADPDDVPALAAVRHAGEALRAAAESPSFALLAARAGAAALHVIDAETARAAPRSAGRSEPPEASWLSRLAAMFAVVRAPLALAGAAAAVFFLVQSPTAPDQGASAQSNEVRRELYDALAQNVLEDSGEPVELPLLADNRAEVEAIDATSTTVVFSTESSGITVIWLAGTEEEEQGT